MDPIDVATIPSCHVVAVPYPGRGHINPMMNVCKLLSSNQGLIITFVVTEEWLGFIGSAPKPSNIRLRSIPNVIPSELVRGANMVSFFEAVNTKMADPFDQLLDQLDQPISWIITDTYLMWAIEIGNRRNIPVASLWTTSPAVFSILYHNDLILFKLHLTAGDDLSERREELLDYIPGINSIKVRELPTAFLPKGAKSPSRVLGAVQCALKAQCLVLTSFYELDTHATDTLRAILPIPIYHVGPTIPYMSLQEKSLDGGDHGHVDYFNWLDSRPKGSVLFVSLGSFLPISGPQMDEIFSGLNLSGVHFLWVVRGNAERLREATKINGEIGLVVQWCDQLRVLCHPSIGGFLTHCGWNSTMEGVFTGVPMITFPLLFDQITNAKWIVEHWKVGIRLKNEVKEENVVKSDEIARAVHRLMDLDGDESKELRRRARELQESCKRAISPGGSSVASLDALVRHVVRGCNN